MSYSSASRSTFTGGGQKNANDELDEYGGKKSGASRLKNSSGTKKDADVDEEYPKYANVTKDDADRNRYNSSNSGGSDGYNSGGIVVREAGGGAGGYGNSGGSSTAYSSGSGGYGNSVLPYGNIVIHTNEVHLHHHRAPPGYGYDGDNRNDDQRRRGGGGGGGGSGFIDRN